MYIINDFQKLTLEEKARFLHKLRLGNEKIFSYQICMSPDHYTVDDIESAIEGLLLCSYRDKMIDIIRQSLLRSAYESGADRYMLWDIAEERLKDLTSEELRIIIRKNLPALQMYMYADVDSADKEYFPPRTIEFNYTAFAYSHKVQDVPRKIRWYYLNRDAYDDIMKLLDENRFGGGFVLFYGEDTDCMEYFAEYENDECSENESLYISESFDSEKIQALAKKYDLNLSKGDRNDNSHL